jgi:hypothetical protein
LESDKEPSLWPLALLGILAVAALFRSKSNAPIQQAIKPVQAQDSTDGDSGIGKNKNDVSAATIAIVEIPPTKAKNDNATQRRKRIKRLRKAGSFWVGLITLIALVAYTTIAKNQWKEMITATRATKSAADTAQKQLEMSERPWLILQGITVDPPGFIFPKDGGAQIGIRPQIRNIGHSVATGVIFRVQLFNPTRNGFFTEPLKKQQELCQPIADKPISNSQWGRGVGDLVIFPNDIEQSWFYGLNLTQAEMDSTKLTVKISGRDVGSSLPSS